MKLTVRHLAAALKEPFVSAAGSVRARDLVLVEIEAAGVAGWGEAAPLGVPVEDVLAGLQRCRAVLEDADATPHAELIETCAGLTETPEALAAIDLALWDLAGRRAGQPVWRLLGGATAGAVEVNATIARADRAGAAAAAAGAVRAGFRCLKVKVGIGDDAGRLAAVRAAAGPDVALRLDANGAWSLTEAAAALRVLEPIGLELCEEPVHGLAAVAELSRQASVPIAIDETATEPGALSRRVCEAVCLKVSRCGGITGTLEAARAARASGYDVYLASMLDGPLGIAAALALAAVIRPRRACGLATLGLFAGRSDPLVPRHGEIPVPASPGLGQELVTWYR